MPMAALLPGDHTPFSATALARTWFASEWSVERQAATCAETEAILTMLSAASISSR